MKNLFHLAQRIFSPDMRYNYDAAAALSTHDYDELVTVAMDVALAHKRTTLDLPLATLHIANNLAKDRQYHAQAFAAYETVADYAMARLAPDMTEIEEKRALYLRKEAAAGMIKYAYALSKPDERIEAYKDASVVALPNSKLELRAVQNFMTEAGNLPKVADRMMHYESVILSESGPSSLRYGAAFSILDDVHRLSDAGKRARFYAYVIQCTDVGSESHKRAKKGWVRDAPPKRPFPTLHDLKQKHAL